MAEEINPAVGAKGSAVLPEGITLLVESFDEDIEIDSVPVSHISDPWQNPEPVGIAGMFEIIGRLDRDSHVMPDAFFDDPEEGEEESQLPDLDHAVGEFTLMYDAERGKKFTGVILRYNTRVDNREIAVTMTVASKGPITQLPEAEAEGE